MRISTYRKAALCGLSLLLSACGLFSKDKVVLDGERVAVLQESSVHTPDFTPGSIKIKLPKPYKNNRWSQNGGNSIHLMGHVAAADNIQEIWSSGFGEGNSKRDYLLAVPAIAYDVVFTIDAEATVSAFRLDDGREIWSKELTPVNEDEYSVSMKGAGIAVYDKKVFVTTGFGSVIALDMKTGDEIWRYEASSPIRIAPTANDNKVFVQTIENNLIALNASNGKEIWNYKTSTENTTVVGGASPAFDPRQDVVVAAFSNGEVRAIKGSTGSTLWGDILTAKRRTNTLTNINGIKANPIIDGDTVFVMGHNNIMVATDLKTGNRLWEKEIGGSSQPWVAGKYLFVMSNDFELMALEKTSGKIIWNTSIPVTKDEDDRAGIFAKGPVLAGDRLLVTSSNGYVFAVSPYTGKVMNYITLPEGADIAPIVVNGVIVFTTNDADIIAYK